MARKTAPVVVDENPRQVTIENVAAIERLEFELPTAGVVVLEGPNGSGKTNALAGISQALGGSNRDASAADGAPMGIVRLGAAELRLTKAKSRLIGTVEFSGLESRLDISKIVDPGIINPESADAERLKAMISVGGVEGRPELFYSLTDGSAEAFEALGVPTTSDVLPMASRVKKAFESHARGHEQAATKHAAAAEAARGSIAHVDLTVEADETALADAYAGAKSALDRMTTHNAGVDTAIENAQIAAAQLEALGDVSDNPQELQDAISGRIDRMNQICDKIQSQKDLIDRANARIATLTSEANNVAVEKSGLETRLQAAQLAAAKRSEMAAAASAAIPPVFTDEQLASATEALAAAKEAINAGAAVRAARKVAEQADHDATLARAEARKAQTARDKAAGVDLILSGLIPEGCPLRYEGGRLVLTTDRDQREPYAELSHGERWRVAIEFAKSELTKKNPEQPPVLILPQEAWESLDPDNQRHVLQLCIDNRLVIVTAKAASGALRATVLANGDSAE